MCRTDVERQLVRDWARDSATPGGSDEVVDADGRALPDRLRQTDAGQTDGGQTDDTLVVPVRVAWLPPERDGDRSARWLEVLTRGDPRRPGAREQQRLVREAPDRVRVVAGEPATVRELRRRWAEESADPADASLDTAALARFVVRAGVLALERAERGLIGDRYKVPRLVVEQITGTARFQALLTELAEAHDLPPEEVRTRATEALHELVAVQSRLSIDLWSAAMRPLHGRAWDVHVDEEGLEALRELNRSQALAFLPSHRSYADTLVLADVLHRRDFPRNHVMGGSNLSFWPIGPLARRAGLVFIRRSFSDDAVYKAVIQEYVGYLVSKRFNLEWYFEGGRSRTGKLRPPRYGLLRYVAAALQDGHAPDVALVPVSITYDHLQEVSTMAGEQAGAVKQSEGLGWLARYARAQQRRSGTVSVRFGTPLSMRERLPVPGPDEGGIAGTGGVAGAGEDATRTALQKIAFDVAVGINRATPVTSMSLVTLALLGVRDRALTLEEVSSVLRPVLDYVDARHLPREGADLRTSPGVRAVLDELTSAGVVTTYAGGNEPVYAIERGQHLVAAFYRNNAVHWFVDRAIVELATLHVAELGSARPLQDAWEECKRLRDLLKFEFFFPERDAFEAALTEELRLLDPDWQDHASTPAAARALLAGSGVVMAHRALRSFFDAQLVVAEQLAARDPRQPVEPKQFLAQCQAVGQQMLLQGRLHGPESLSRELFEGALKLAANRDLVDPGRDELRLRREALVIELRDVTRRIAAAQQIDEQIQHLDSRQPAGQGHTRAAG